MWIEIVLSVTFTLQWASPTLCDRVDYIVQARIFSMPIFSRPEYWSGDPFLSPGNLPSLGIEPRSPVLQADSLPVEPHGKHNERVRKYLKGA